MLLLALMAGFQSGIKIVTTGGIKKALLVGGIVAVITVGDAAYNVYNSVISTEQANVFTQDCNKLENHVVIRHLDTTRTSLLKLECVINTGQETVIVEDTGLRAWLLANYNLLTAI